jgi:hypothetical protein
MSLEPRPHGRHQREIPFTVTSGAPGRAMFICFETFDQANVGINYRPHPQLVFRFDSR